MDYRKPALTFEAQLQQLKDRGLNVADEPAALQWLSQVSYYRLSAYSLPFRQSDRFAPGTDFSDIAALYDFDRRLRLLMLDAIERIEVSVRTALTYDLAHAHGPFGHVDHRNFAPAFRHARFMEELAKEEARAKETFAEHFRATYTSEAHLPIWMATELISFGALSQLYAHASPTIRRSVASRYGVQESVFGNWLHALSYVRNVCAHHKRLWNRDLAIRPMIPRNDRVLSRLNMSNRRFAAIFAVAIHLIRRIAPDSTWAERVGDLFGESPFVPLPPVGFGAFSSARQFVQRFGASEQS